MIINDDQYIEELFAAVQNDLLVSCKFCAIKVSTHDILRDHYALCSAYQRKLAKKTYERAEFLWSLFCKITPQISFDFKYPTGRKPFIRAEITIPDRREEPQALLFVLIIRRNTKNPTEYRFDIALADKQPEPPRFPLNFGAILAFSRDELKCEVKALDHVRKIPLFHITSTRSHFRMWTYVF
jgi:hypothetical protein